MKTPVLTTDAVIIKKEKVLLIKRAIDPFKGEWVLPGGHVEYGEKVEEALKREVKEELNQEIEIKGIIGIFSDPERDPRYHSVSIACLCELKGENNIKLDKESSEYKFFPFSNLPSKIGFDHKKIILYSKLRNGQIKNTKEP